MSTDNIVSIIPAGGAMAALGGAVGDAVGAATDGVLVTFKTHGGGTRTYAYSGSDAEAILAGADPAQFSGTRVE